jgi:glycosyltransferase involved in cell wall biosynthesis
MARIAFASYEMAPTTKGGAGVLIRNLAEVLLRDGHEVILVLDVPPWEFEQFVTTDRFVLPEAERCRAYHVGSVVEAIGSTTEEDFSSHFEWRAYRFDLACRIVSEQEKPDILEFFDYGGVGHYALSAKVAGLAYRDTHLAVRLHTSLELMDRVAAESAYDFEREMVYALEHGALRLAETVLFPTPSYLEEDYAPFYEPWLGDLVESPPPIVDAPRPRRPSETPDVALFYGRLSPLKGVDLFIEAAVEMLRQGLAGDLLFYMVGFDPEFPDAPYRSGEEIRRRIPTEFQERFIFKGQWGRRRLERLLPRVRFAVFPTFIESFGYAAHELRSAGVPLVLSPIPAFRDAFTDEVDALFFDGSTSDLARRMGRMNDDESLRQRLSVVSETPADPQLTFYYGPHHSWITPADVHRPAGDLLVCVIADNENLLGPTLVSIETASGTSREVVVLRPTDDGSSSGTVAFLGGRYHMETAEGGSVRPSDVLTRSYLLVLRAGDQIEPWFIEGCAGILNRQPEIGYAGSWKKSHTGIVDTFPVDLMPEALPLLGRAPINRCVIRTEPGRLLSDLFDARAGILGEAVHLCSAVGMLVPVVGMTSHDEGLRPPSGEEITYSIGSGRSRLQTERLARLFELLPARDGDTSIEEISEREVMAGGTS